MKSKEPTSIPNSIERLLCNLRQLPLTKQLKFLILFHILVYPSKKINIFLIFSLRINTHSLSRMLIDHWRLKAILNQASLTLECLILRFKGNLLTIFRMWVHFLAITKAPSMLIRITSKIKTNTWKVTLKNQ